MPASPSVDVRRVWKRYRRSSGWVLRDVDLSVDAGTVAVVLGGNGDGKSTLLRVVAGASSVTRGEVRRPRTSTSYVPERLPADLRMTAGRYLKHMAGLRGRHARTTLSRSMELLELFGLSPGPDVPVARLSKGNRQKVSLAQAFGFPAELTVLDEPFSGLDGTAGNELMLLLDRTRADGRSVLVSAHHPGSLGRFDAFHRLDGGKLHPVDLASVRQPRPEPGPGTLLVLRAVGTAPAAGSLDGVDGVRSVDTDSVAGCVVVATDDPDELLRVALGSGWSFVRGGVPQPEVGKSP